MPECCRSFFWKIASITVYDSLLGKRHFYVLYCIKSCKIALLFISTRVLQWRGVNSFPNRWLTLLPFHLSTSPAAKHSHATRHTETTTENSFNFYLCCDKVIYSFIHIVHQPNGTPVYCKNEDKEWQDSYQFIVILRVMKCHKRLTCIITL